MKLRYIIATLAAAAALFTGCKEEGDTYFNEIRVSQSYVGIPMEEGGSQEITVTAQGDWAITLPDGCDWLTVNPASGSAGETKVTISAEGTLDGRNAELLLTCLGRVLRINVIQGLSQVSEATVKEVNEGPEKQYRVTGTVTRISDPHFGNIYINDGSVEGDGVYIYGILDKKGNVMNKATAYDVLNSGHENAYELSVGDKITVEGPKVLYYETVELKNVAIIDIVKSLVKVIPMDIELEGPEAGDTLIKIATKAPSIKVKPNDDWLYVKEIEQKKDTVYALIGFFANEGVTKREGTISVTGEGFKDITVTITQGANAPDLMPIAEASKQPYSHAKGKISAINKQGYILSDDSGSINVYYGKNIDLTKYSIGDEIEIIGDVVAYNFGPQFSCKGKDGFDLEEKLSEGSGSYIYPTPEVFDETALDALVASVNGKTKDKLEDAITIKYVQLVGIPKKSGSYTNIYVGEAVNDLSASYPLDEFNLTPMLDKTVTIKGYLINIAGSNSPYHVNIVISSLEEGAAEEPEDYLVASFAENNEGFTFENVTLPSELTYVWQYNSQYHYLKASAFKDNAYASESIAVSPEIDLTNATHAYLSFQHACNKFASVESLPDVLSVEVKVGETWHKLAAPAWSGNSSWNFVASGDLDMSEYVGNMVKIGFRYVSTTNNCGTWEVKQVKVCNYTSE